MLAYMPSVIKKRSTTLPSGVVDTFTLWIKSSSSDSICVTSANHTSHSVELQFQTSNRRRGSCTYHVTVLCGQVTRAWGGRTWGGLAGWYRGRKGWSMRKGTWTWGGSWGSPTGFWWMRSGARPRTPQNTSVRRWIHLLEWWNTWTLVNNKGLHICRIMTCRL